MKYQLYLDIESKIEMCNTEARLALSTALKFKVNLVKVAALQNKMLGTERMFRVRLHVVQVEY